MITLKTTEHLTGVEISGSFEDLNMLYDALTNLTGDDMSYSGYYQSSLHVLALCYDIRHAYQGDREKAKSPYGEEHYSFKWYWPDLLFVYAVLEDFIDISCGPQCYLRREDAEKRFFNPETKDMLLDRLPDDIALTNYFRELIRNELGRVIDEKKFRSIFRKIDSGYYNKQDFINYRTQMISILTVKYAKRAPEKRRTYLATIAEKIFFGNDDYDIIANAVNRFATEEGVDPSDIVLEGMEYPEKQEW
ncbi:MAG: hypothetical protein MJ177_02760 [Clostridia bacterium]|nr:hypothetical protein [Clostridia bacterium]